VKGKNPSTKALRRPCSEEGSYPPPCNLMATKPQPGLAGGGGPVLPWTSFFTSQR